MKVANCLLICLSLVSCTCKKDVKDPYQMKPPYKLLNLYSQKIKPETDLVLRGYGFNWCLPEGYQKNGIGNFAASYSLEKNRNDEISLEYARKLIVFVAENLTVEINNNGEVRPDLDVYPFVSNLLNISLYFEDKDRVQLGQEAAIVYFANGKIKYEGYHIEGYRKPGWAYGKHYIIHEESYDEALQIVKKQGGLKYI